MFAVTDRTNVIVRMYQVLLYYFRRLSKRNETKSNSFAGRHHYRQRIWCLLYPLKGCPRCLTPPW